MFKEYIESKKEELIKDLEQMIKIPSKLEGYDNPEYPFGKNIDNALNKFLEIGKKLGFRTKNIDKYCGYIEFGEGEELVGIVGHLDVVPEGEGWIHPPFELTIEDGKLYGRGTIDDKGPMIAALYAMKAVKEKSETNKRVRLIIGLNEENDWKGINYYKEHEEMPTVGFSPDADFPCIYSEKALLTVYTEEEYTENQRIKIKNIDCKNNRINVVPKYCAVKLEVEEDISEKLKNMLIEKIQEDISFTRIQNEFYIETRGIQAHAAHPELGINAVSKMVVLLNEIFNKFGVKNETINKLANKIGEEFDGASLGIKHKNNELGNLTLNLAQLELSDKKIKSGMNLRIPGDIKIEDIKTKIAEELKQINPRFCGINEALYIPKDNELVQKLCKIYNNYTNQNKEPLAIGGATFARAFKNCISFGAMRPEEPDMCHQVDEYIELQNLIDSCNIYAIAIYELAK